MLIDRLPWVLGLLVLFYVGLATGFLKREPYGSFWTHHALGLLLVLYPATWTWYLGWLLFIDDLENHFARAHNQETLLHWCGHPLYWLHDWIGYHVIPEGRWREWWLTR